METVELSAHVRDLKVTARNLRKNKIIPAVIYGHNEESSSLQLEYQEFRKAFMKAGKNQIITLTIDGKKKAPVLVHEIQFHPLTGTIDHVDFLHVNLKVEVTTQVPVEVVGVSPAVKNFGGILNVVKHQLTVRCLPLDLPQSIQVDVSKLESLGVALHISDLELPKGVMALDPADATVVTVNAAKVEAETTETATSAIAGTAAEAAAAEDAAKAAEAAKAQGNDKKEDKK